MTTTLTAQADLIAPDFIVTAKSQDSKLLISALPPKGHHFNKDAPKFVTVSPGSNGQNGRIAPKKSSEKELGFELPSDSPGSFTLSAYLCDDALTFCEKHDVSVKWDGKILVSDSLGTKLRTTGPMVRSNESLKKDEHGFVMNQPEAAIALAKKESKPLMIDFYGIWCPPCNELDEFVFGSPEFQKQAKNFVLLKLDVDSDVSWPLKAKFKVGGYPTLVFSTGDSEEISRVVGYREARFLAHEMKQAYANRDTSETQLQIKADAGDPKAAARLGMIYYERNEHEKARTYLGKSTEHRVELRDSEITLTESDKPAYRLALTRGISEFPHSPNAIEWLSRLADLDKDENQPKEREKNLQQLISSAHELIAHPKSLAGQDMEIEDLWVSIAEAYEGLNDPVHSKENWRKAADVYHSKISSDRERGYNLEYAACLWHAGDLESARKIYQKLETYYPEEFTFFYAHGKMAFENKIYPEARETAALALAHSYGDNHLRSALLVAQIQKAEGKIPEARKTVGDALKSSRVPEDSAIRTHRHLKALQELRRELEKS